jgi:hypothetical protein
MLNNRFEFLSTIDYPRFDKIKPNKTELTMLAMPVMIWIFSAIPK